MLHLTEMITDVINYAHRIVKEKRIKRRRKEEKLFKFVLLNRVNTLLIKSK